MSAPHPIPAIQRRAGAAGKKLPGFVSLKTAENVGFPVAEEGSIFNT